MKEKILFILEKACKRIYKNDRYLIDNRVCERAIVFWLGIYIQRIISRDSQLKFYDLDNEYNRNGQDSKRTPNFKNGTYPDLIIHKRGSNEKNVIIIECKTNWNNDIHIDLQKLKNFICIKGEYKYKYGVSIIFKINTIEIRILEHGKADIFKKIEVKELKKN